MSEKNASTRTCFVISQIGAENSEQRKFADVVLRHIIEPAVAACGYDALRADAISEPGLITSQAITHVIEG